MRRAKPFIIIAVVILIMWGLISLLPEGGSGLPGSMYSTEEEGLAALERWLSDLEFETAPMEFVQWSLDDEFDALIIVEPNTISQDEADEALRWVRETGATLIVVDTQENALFREYNVTVEDHPASVGAGVSVNPLAHPPVGSVNTQGLATLSSSRRDAAVIVESPKDGPYVLAFAEGRGLVYLSSRSDIWSNRGLRADENAKLVLNTLSRVPAGGTIVFDEIHHGRDLPPAVPRKPVSFPPLVASLVYLALVVGLWTFLAGRRFGSAVPLRMDIARRTSGEYVQSMANLFERGRQTGYILAFYKTAFKRRLARPFGFNPRIDDERFVRELSRYIKVDERRLASLLQEMGRERPAEGVLLQLVHESDAFAAQLEQQR